jgi:HD-GYP domain-containing protein (c-di-GMP phosphodiesterase class II)
MTQPPRRTGVPPRVRLYVLATVAAAVLLLPLCRLSDGAWQGPVAFVLLAPLVGFITVANRSPIHIGLKRNLNVGTAPEVAAVLLLPGPMAVLALLLGAALGEWGNRGPLIQCTFNVAVAVLRALTGLTLNALLLRLGPTMVLGLPAAVAAAGGMYLASTLLVVGVAAVQLRDNPLRRAWTSTRAVVLLEAMLSFTGIMAAFAAVGQPAALLLLAAPAVIAYRAARDQVALQAQTRLALEELADIVDLRDHYTYEHSRRVAELARATARRLGLSAEMVDLVTMAGRVHDVGKIGIKSSVLMKPGPLSSAEWQERRSHAEVGARLIARFPQFAAGQAFVRHHHERFDGTGYPRGLAGQQIPLGARVLAVADAWDAMTSHRAYRRALDAAFVREELRRGSGSQFDPVVVEAFLAAIAERPELVAVAMDGAQEVDELPAAPPRAPEPAESAA